MHLATSLPATDFTLDYDPERDLLLVRWLRSMSLPELQQAYADLLAAAQAYGNCRHWLLDVRRRLVGDPEALAWFNEHFVPGLRAALGGPVHIAYFAMINHDTAVGHELVRQCIELGERSHNYFRYFNREDEAVAWLAGQP